MKVYFVFIFCCLWGVSATFSQKIGNSYLPPYSPDSPKWFHVFYQEDKLAKIDVRELDKEVKEYEKEIMRKMEEVENDILTGEENEDMYVLYYKRWRHAMDKYVNENGFLKIEKEADINTAMPSSQKAEASNSTWSLVGPTETFGSASNSKVPWQSNIYAIAVYPSNTNILYACPEGGGIFKTTDKGLNWTCLTANYPIHSCTAIEVHPTNPNIVYAGRTNQLIYSVDGGVTWNIESFPCGNVHKISFKPSDPSKIFVAADYGLFTTAVANTAFSAGMVFNVAGLQTSSPTWNRNSTGATCTASAGTNQYYHVFPFTVSVSGSYTFSMCTRPNGPWWYDWDAHASLFQNAFNGAAPCSVPANLIYADNNTNTGGNCEDDPLITAVLATGITYYLVTTSSSTLVTGGFQWTFTGPSGAILTALNPSWQQVPTVATECNDFYFKTDNDNIAFCLKKVNGFNEFWRSTDGGNTFVASTTGWIGKGITSDGGGRIAVSPADPNRLYAVLLGNSPSPNKPFLFRSNDAGLTWDTLCTGRGTGLVGNNTAPLGMSNGQGFYDLDIVANALDANQLIVAGTSAYRSTDGGLTFSAIGGYLGSSAPGISLGIHPDIQEMISVGGDSWITTDGGVNYSSDFFATTTNFSPRCKGIFASDMWGFAQGWNEDIVGGGRYHNGNTAMSEQYPAGEAIRLGGGEAATGYYMIGRPQHIAFSDIAPKILPTARNGALTNFSFTKFPNEDGYGNDMSEVEFLPYCYNTIFVGNGNELWKSTDGGVTWVSLYTFAGRVKEFEISRSNPNVIYLATNTPTQLQKSTDGGSTWTVLTLPSGVSINRVSLSLSYTDENVLYMVSPSNTSNNRVFKTTNGGTSWTNLTTSTINGQAYTAIVYHNGTDNGVYIFGDNGVVFYKSDSETDWVAFNSSLPSVHNNEHILPFYRDSKIRSAGNQGVWQVDFYEEGAPVAQPTVDKLTSVCPRDTFYFDDYSALKHIGATWNWSFTGASYISSSTVRNPKVVFSGMGTYDFSLTVSNSMGSNSKTIIGKISITGNECGVDTIPGKMLTLNIGGDYAQQSAPIDITTNNITLIAWIKPNGNQMSFAGLIFSASGGATGLDFRNSNQIGYHWANTAGSYNWGGGPTLPIGQWSHVALVVKDGPGTSDTAFIYVDGKQYYRVGQHDPVNFNSVFQFGIDRSNTSRNYIGDMDEIAMYNRALSKNEIRELMNLTRNNPNIGSMPSYDASLIAYYQFNEITSNNIYDKVGTKYATLVGGATKTAISTAPVGGGKFQRMAVTNGGVKNFANAGLSMTFPTTGTYPNGDLVVTRLHVAPDQLCSTTILPNPSGYWVIRNYGVNATFSSLTEMKFLNVQGTNGLIASTPSFLTLFKRNSNDFGATWGSGIDDGDIVVNTLGIGNITFNIGLNVTSFSQFSIAVSASALPIQLVSFDAQLLDNQTAKLIWFSENEVNFNGFEVQKSIDGNVFMPISFVGTKGGGNYQFIDYQLYGGNNYYRLKLLDLDGKSEYSSIRVLSPNVSALFSVYPNPNEDGWFSLKMNTDKEFCRITVADALGQTVYAIPIESIRSNLPIHFHLPLSAGVYYLHLQTLEGEHFRERVIIE